MRVIWAVMAILLVGCAPPQSSPSLQAGAPSQNIREYSEVAPDIGQMLAALDLTLDQPVAEADTPLIELEKQTLSYSFGKPGDSQIPEPLKTLATSVFWRLNDVRTTQQPIALEFREGHVPMVQAEGRKILVSAGTLALLSSREDFAKLLAFEIALIDRGYGELRYRTPILIRDLMRQVKVRRPSASVTETRVLAVRGTIALLAQRFKAADQDACSMLVRTGYACNGAQTAMMVANRLSEASLTVNGQFFIQRIPFNMPAAPTKGPSVANSRYEAAWIKASEGMMVGASRDVLAGQGLELLNRRDGVRFRLPGVESGKPVGRGVFLFMVDGSTGYIVSAPSDELIPWGRFGTLIETGEMQPKAYRTVSWQAYAMGEENGLVARWPLGEQTYEVFLKGSLPIASLRSRASDLFAQMWVNDARALMLRHPEQRLAVRTIASRAEAADLERNSSPPMSFAGGWNKFLFPMLNNAETLEGMPDQQQMIRYLP